MGNNKSVHQGLDIISHNIIGYFKQKKFNYKKIESRAKLIHKKSLSYQDLSIEELQEKILDIKDNFKLNRINDEIIDEALSIICEISNRTIKKRPYLEQIAGAICIYDGYILEMSTGEGKTITATISSILFAWKNKPCHLFTSNEYLAQRDSELMTVLYNTCFVSVGFVATQMSKEEKIENYKKDIVYSTSNAVLADYLKDEMAVEYSFNSQLELITSLDKKNEKYDRILVKGLHTAIIDEADSVLADEALTPLIISNQQEDKELQKAILLSYNLIKNLKETKHYISYELFKTIEFTKLGKEFIEDNRKYYPNKWNTYSRVEYLINQAIVARDFYKINKQYIIQEEKIVIVDEKTGRIMDSRSWSGGLHQAIEAKENLDFTNPTKAMSKMSFQNFFRMYKVLTGMTGTVKNIEKELWQIYELNIAKIPTRLKKKHTFYKEMIFLNDEEKIDAIVNDIKKISINNRPILIGTRTIVDSQKIYNKLLILGFKNIELLNALTSDKEAEVIASAGEMGKITISTNMAGRGTDILLSKEAIDNGGLHIIATERNESRRVDLQLYGRASRQGQSGSSKTFLSLDDVLINLYLPKFLLNFLKINIRSKIIQKLAIKLYILSQYIAEKSSSKVRRNMLSIDFDFQKKMSFIKSKN